VSCGDVWRSFKDWEIFLFGVVHHNEKITAQQNKIFIHTEFRKRFKLIFPFSLQNAKDFDGEGGG
jgi:hypothetical protein